MIVKFDGKTVEEVLGQLVGACSSTRFWDQMPENYPYGAGTFLDENALTLVQAALENLAVLGILGDDNEPADPPLPSQEPRCCLDYPFCKH